MLVIFQLGTYQQTLYVFNEIYKKRLDMILQRLVEQGMIDYFDRKVLMSLGVKDGKSWTPSLNITSVTLEELKFMVFVMLIGLFASLVVFVIEIIIGNLLCRKELQ